VLTKPNPLSLPEVPRLPIVMLTIYRLPRGHVVARELRPPREVPELELSTAP